MAKVGYLPTAIESRTSNAEESIIQEPRIPIRGRNKRVTKVPDRWSILEATERALVGHVKPSPTPQPNVQGYKRAVLAIEPSLSARQQMSVAKAIVVTRSCGVMRATWSERFTQPATLALRVDRRKPYIGGTLPLLHTPHVDRSLEPQLAGLPDGVTVLLGGTQPPAVTSPLPLSWLARVCHVGMVVPAQRRIAERERYKPNNACPKPTKLSEEHVIRAGTCTRLAIPPLMSTCWVGFDNGVTANGSTIARVETSLVVLWHTNGVWVRCSHVSTQTSIAVVRCCEVPLTRVLRTFVVINTTLPTKTCTKTDLFATRVHSRNTVHAVPPQTPSRVARNAKQTIYGVSITPLVRFVSVVACWVTIIRSSAEDTFCLRLVVSRTSCYHKEYASECATLSSNEPKVPSVLRNGEL